MIRIKYNQNDRIDLLFYNTYISMCCVVLCCVWLLKDGSDENIRWGVADPIPIKRTESLTPSVEKGSIGPFKLRLLLLHHPLVWFHSIYITSSCQPKNNNFQKIIGNYFFSSYSFYISTNYVIHWKLFTLISLTLLFILRFFLWVIILFT